MTNIWILAWSLLVGTNATQQYCYIEFVGGSSGGWTEPWTMTVQFYAPTNGTFAVQVGTDKQVWGTITNRFDKPKGTNIVTVPFPPWGFTGSDVECVMTRIVGLSGPITNFPSYYTNNSYQSQGSFSRFDLSPEDQGTALQWQYENAIKANDPSAAVFPVKENVQKK